MYLQKMVTSGFSALTLGLPSLMHWKLYRNGLGEKCANNDISVLSHRYELISSSGELVFPGNFCDREVYGVDYFSIFDFL